MFRSPVTLIVLPFLFAALVASAQTETPSFPPLKQNADGRLTPANTVNMPGLADRSKPAGPLGRIVSRDLRTGEVTVREGLSREDFLSGTFRPGGDGVLTGPAVDPADKNFTFWAQVSDPTVGTYPRHLKVKICWDGPCDEPFGGHCSGTLIDPMHVITAAHCIYSFDEDHPGWAEEVRVIPGYENHHEPWGDAHARAQAAQLHIWEGWGADHDAHHDIGIIDLDRPIGALAGWRGYGTNDGCNWYYDAGWVHRAYPAEDPYDGELMFENGGSFDECYSEYDLDWHLVAFDNPSWGGSSGTGSVRDNVVWSVLRGSDRETRSDGALITSGKFAGIETIRLEDMPATHDLMPIYVQVASTHVEPGYSLDIDFILASYAQQGLQAGVNCDIYLSPDETITTGDVWLGDITVQAELPPMSAQNVDNVPLIPVPPGTTPGRYFIGVILDYTDANLANNITAPVELDSIVVSCPEPNRPAILSPSHEATCQPLALTIDWDDQPQIEAYQMLLGAWCGDTQHYYYGPTSQYTVSGLEYDTTYYVWVRAKKFCGAWGVWSGCYNFTTLDAPTSEIQFLAPNPGDVCQDSTLVSIAWQPVPDADDYQLRVGESCGNGAVFTLDATTPYNDLTGLSGGTTYFYQVRVKGACGNWGVWSECREFSTLPGIYPVPEPIYPSDGYACVGSSGILNWAPPGYPCTYEVEWGADCRMDTTVVVSNNYLILPSLAEGTWYWHVRALHVCGESSSWSSCLSFGVDATPPVWPEGLESPTHATSIWSGDPYVTTRWEDATDDCNLEYRVLWDHAPATVPDSLAQTIPDLQHTSEPLAAGDDHWVHVLAKDIGGNLAANPQHLGPFWIDTTPPAVEVINPVGGQRLNSGYSVIVGWTAADPLSGLDATAVHYTVDAGASWQLVTTLADPLITTCEWTVPEATTDSARVRVTITDVVGNVGQGTNERWFSIGSFSSAGDPLPAFSLHQNSPNPFNPATTIRYETPRSEAVSLRVFDISGKLVRTLVASVVPAGQHEVVWIGSDETGRQVSAGVYFYRLQAGDFGETRRMTIVK